MRNHLWEKFSMREIEYEEIKRERRETPIGPGRRGAGAGGGATKGSGGVR